MKKIIGTISILVIGIALVSIVEFFVFKNKAKVWVEYEREQYAMAVDAYNIAKDKYEAEYKKVIEYKESLDSSIEEMEGQISNLTEELNSIYEERQQEKKVEEERYESLSEEEKEYERHVTEYNQMISNLRKNNPEYEEVYLKIVKYLDTDISRMSTKEIETFYNLILEKHKYENEYRKESKDN